MEMRYHQRAIEPVPPGSPYPRHPASPQQIVTTEFSDLLSWDIAPDGDGYLVVGRMVGDDAGSPVSFRGGRRDRSAAGVGELRVVVDWFEEIRRRSSSGASAGP
jgi:hypothetical protein